MLLWLLLETVNEMIASQMGQLHCERRIKPLSVIWGVMAEAVERIAPTIKLV